MERINYSWELASIGLVICVILLLISKPVVTYNNPQNNNVAKGIWLFFVLYILNSIFSLWEWDTYHSWSEFKMGENYSFFSIESYEPIYNWLAGVTHFNYFLWRACIWTPACLFIYWVGKRLDILNRNFLLSIALFLAFHYSTRNLLGISILIFGLVLLIDDNRRVRIWGLGFVIASYFFHKTMYITMLFALLAFLPINKRSVRILLLFFPFLSMITTYIVNNLASGAWLIALGDLGAEGNKVQMYTSQDRMDATFFGMLDRFITYVPQYLALFYVTKRIIYDHILDKDNRQKIWLHLYRFSFVAIYIASTFYFTKTSFWIFERFKYMGIIPLVFVLAKVWSIENKTNFWVKSIIILQMLSLTFRWVVQYYHWS